MLSTRKPEEPNFSFNHVRGSQEAFGQPPWTGPGPWARRPGPSWSKHRHEIRVTPRLRPTRFPEEPLNLALFTRICTNACRHAGGKVGRLRERAGKAGG